MGRIRRQGEAYCLTRARPQDDLPQVVAACDAIHGHPKPVIAEHGSDDRFDIVNTQIVEHLLMSMSRIESVHGYVKGEAELWRP